MMKYLYSFLAAGMFAAAFSTVAATTLPVEIPVFEKTVFYDGYQPVVVDSELNDGVLRHRNSQYAVKLSDETLDKIGDHVGLEVTIGALCDNYDRIGNISIAFVPKGSETYVYDEVQRVEIARFITPFMDKNVMPDEVPYSYDLPGVELILRDASLRSAYDFWMEFEVFGVPYAANSEIEGCAGRNDVFKGTAVLRTEAEPAAPVSGHVLVPIYVKQPEDKGNINMNNYNECATDTLNKTTRTFEFEVPRDVTDSKIVLIMSNHGAGAFGEEYVRRLHLLYFDDELTYTYTPGGVSCEPYRKYNTQLNGIYGYSPRSDAYWEDSNWCPGQAVPMREIITGPLKAGKHKLMIRVPEARFYKRDGDFRPSIYFQGVEQGQLPISVPQLNAVRADITFFVEGNMVRLEGGDTATRLELLSFDGTPLYGVNGPVSEFDLSSWSKGVYILVASTADGSTAFTKVVRK